jgi:hypothetical protein
MELWLLKLDQHGELDKEAFTCEVRGQLINISGATIDRMLAPTRKSLRLKGISATKAGSLLRNSITVRRAGGEHVHLNQESYRLAGEQARQKYSSL